LAIERSSPARVCGSADCSSDSCSAWRTPWRRSHQVDEQGRPTDGVLRLYDVFNLKLSADLVVLSGCQTGLGRQMTGEGLIGLTRGFMYAGAPRIIASLWEVDDVATAALVRHFYQVLLTRKMTPAIALATAQRQMRADPRWRSPFYWASFTLLGDWR
jgi:CHAT domain-containing protein